MLKFSANTVRSLQYYVYGLRYPDNENNYFYIGKGKGNRVFYHVNQKTRSGIKDPKFDIIESLRKIGGPEIDIIRHGLTEKEALLLEAALIDVFKVKQISNKVKGIDSDKFGIMSIKNIEANYKGKDFTLDISAVCFKINQAWHKNMDEEHLYNKIRGNWALNLKRAVKAEYGIGVHNGIIRGIYKICNWEKGRSSTRSHRYFFNGYKEENMNKYIGYSLLNHPGHAVRGPLFYYNN